MHFFVHRRDNEREKGRRYEQNAEAQKAVVPQLR